MIMTLGTFQGGTQPGGTRGIYPVKHLIHPVLLGMNTRLHIAGGCTVKAGGDFLICGCIGKQISGNLLDGKLIEGHILIDGIDHPVPECPAIPELICLKPV